MQEVEFCSRQCGLVGFVKLIRSLHHERLGVLWRFWLLGAMRQRGGGRRCHCRGELSIRLTLVSLWDGWCCLVALLAPVRPWLLRHGP